MRYIALCVVLAQGRSGGATQCSVRFDGAISTAASTSDLLKSRRYGWRPTPSAPFTVDGRVRRACVCTPLPIHPPLTHLTRTHTACVLSVVCLPFAVVHWRRCCRRGMRSGIRTPSNPPNRAPKHSRPPRSRSAQRMALHHIRIAALHHSLNSSLSSHVYPLLFGHVLVPTLTHSTHLSLTF